MLCSLVRVQRNGRSQSEWHKACLNPLGIVLSPQNNWTDLLRGMSSGLFVILPQAPPKILQWRAERTYCASPIWSMVKMFSTALEFSHIFKEKCLSASLHCIRLGMHKSAWSVYGGCWSNLICVGQWKPHSTVTALLYCGMSASMSSWMCTSSVQSEHSTLFIGHSLAGLSDCYRMHSANCLVTNLRGISKSHVGTRYQWVMCLGLAT